jgi:ligand-binding sensor domain-containing protein
MPAATPALSPVYHHWDQQDGLPSWNIDVFLQDSRGIMWMETSAGLVNFDGFDFRLIPTAYTAQRPEKILGLAEDVHGNIW